MSDNRGQKGLCEDVLDRDRCALCGACASLCPYLRSFEGRMVKMNSCDIDRGRCFAYCPRTPFAPEEVRRETFARGELGTYRTVAAARATDRAVRGKGQNGGVVTALVACALDQGIATAAVLTARGDDLLPEGRIVRRKEDVFACSGSSYVACPTLETFNRGPWGEDETIALVGTPCQVLAFGKMRASDLEKRTPVDRVSLVIGLFCTWAFTSDPFLRFLKEKVNFAAIRKLDITPPPERLLKVHTDDSIVDVPLDEVRPFVRPACGTCPDMTSETADVSVGSVEGWEGWNTLIVRSERGEALVNGCREAGMIEVRDLPDEKVEHLKQASLLKKERALAALENGEASRREGNETDPQPFHTI